MTILTRLASMVRWVLRRDRAEADLDDEVKAFVEMAAAQHVRDGATPDEARRLATLELGGVDQVKERVRHGRHGGWLDEIGRDVRYGFRQVRRTPGFSAVAIATLALGIGINTAMFSAVDAVLIRPLPYADADRLVMVWIDTSNREGEAKFFPTPPEWRLWRQHNTVFTDIAATQPVDASLSGDGEPEQVPARKVSPNFWSVLGVTPRVGRVFTEEEDRQGARLVVISHGMWLRRFGGSPDVIGRTITLNDTAHEIVGVMPENFYFMPARDIDIWMPTSYTPRMLDHWGWHDLHTVARLKPGVSLPEAHEAMAALNLRLSAEHVPLPRAANVTPLREELTGKTSTSLLVLLGAAGAVLLIACLNLANLLLARGAARQREVAIRGALGAGRSRLIRQFLIESLVLAGLGTVAGLALALPAMRFLERLVPLTMGAVRLTVDWRVLAFSIAIAMASAVVFGLVPAIRGSRVAFQDTLRDGGRGLAGSRSHRLQHSLIVAETALAVALLTTGGLLLQTFHHLWQQDLGIERERLLTLVTPLFRYKDFDRRVLVVNDQIERIRAIPGIVSAGAISDIPLTEDAQATFYRLEGQTNEQTHQQVALTRVVTRGYFATVGASAREGRFFDSTDTRSDQPAAVVNESFARRHYPGTSALGKRFQFGNRGSKGYWYSIVGVVREIRDRGVVAEVRPTIYRVHEQADQAWNHPSGIVIRTAIDAESIIPAVREAIWSIDRNQPIARVQTMDAIVSEQLSVPSQNTVLLGAYALLALGLASIGLYGVLSYAVAQRTNEIGVRMAMGAHGRDILISVCGRGLVLTLAGLGIGLGLAVIAARTMSALFYDVAPDYLSAAAIASAALLAVAAVACIIPANRASRISPVVALQQE